MINELFHLHKSLERCGLKPPDLHPSVKSPKRQEGFVVGIAANGQVATVERCKPDRMASLWMIMPDNQNRFPVIPLKAPIFKVALAAEEVSDLHEQDAQKRCVALQRICEKAELAYTSKRLKKLSSRIRDFPLRLKPDFQNTPRSLEAFRELIERLATHALSADTFLNQLTFTAIKCCHSGRLEVDAIDLVESLLIGKWNEKAQAFKSIDIPIVFDVDDYHKFEERVAAPQLKSVISEQLLAAMIDSPEEGVCSLTGEMTPLEKDKFPNPNLPVLGPTYIMSMNKDARCHHRYGAIGPQVFAAGKRLTRELQNALVYITSKEREGKTWRPIPNHRKENKGEKRDLLIVYLEERPDAAIALADLFAEASQNSMEQAVFEETVATVCSALEGEPGIQKNSLLRILVLTNVDPGRKQVVLSGAFSVEAVRKGVEEWQKSSKNHPPISLPMPGKKGEKAVLGESSCPSPAAVMRLFQHQWIRGGTGATDIVGCRLSDVYELFVNGHRNVEPRLHHLLRLALQRTAPLLVGIGGALCTRQWKPFRNDAPRVALVTVSLMSILLYKLGYRKEVYMKEIAFNVGRLLALADTLHKEYCRHVRNAETPAQLIGNALMSTALENPERVLVRLSERIPIYQAWGNKVQGKEFGLVKWTLGQMGEVCNTLSEYPIPGRIDDAAKAQMLLGYLARPERKASGKEAINVTPADEETSK